MMEAIRCVLLCMLEAMESGFLFVEEVEVMDVLDVPEVMRSV